MYSAASGNYFPAMYRGKQHNDDNQGMPVGTANDSVMQLIGTDQFVLPGIPRPVHICHKFLDASLPLVLVQTLCIHGMWVLFDEHNVMVFNKLGNIVTQGKHDPFQNLYMIPIDTMHDTQLRLLAPQPRVAMTCWALSTTRFVPEPISHIRQWAANAYKIWLIQALISYLHAMTGWLPKETLLAGINADFYLSWPGFSAPRGWQHLKKTEPTIYGHQKLICKGIQTCTKKKQSKNHDVGVAIVDPNNNDDMKNMIAMDLFQHFFITSGSGNKYIFIMLDYNSDYIKATPMSS